VAHDVDNFTSFEISVAPIPANYDDEGNRLRSIIASDPPEHTPERRLMLPFFGPKAVEKYRESTRELSRRLITGFIEDGRADAAADYARQIPPRVIADILGIDPDMSDQFTEWVQGVLEFGLQDPEVREKYRVIIQDFFDSEIERRKVDPDDNLISFLLRAELDGEPVPMHVVRANLGLMLIAGIDTTWSSIGSALWHLAAHPEDRQRLVDEPELLPLAIEEFLRAYSPVTMARLARNDTEIAGCPVTKGERVLLSFPAANRDPEVFDDAEEVIIDRAVNRHVAFGVGIHRCLGSNLARMEMQVAIEEFLARIPEFELEDPEAVTWAGGQVRGPRHLPVRFPVRTALD
ncbi:MAG: cytochrome P450, partial [Acidimicrobiia bacterium]|nr:cytochrome P450 [Acidimicrobiia bacterium]